MRYLAAALGLALLASAGLAGAEETTRIYRQGGSTAVITQKGGGPTTVRRTITGPSGQTIVQQQGGGAAAVAQILQDRRVRPVRSLFEWLTPRAKKGNPVAAQKDEKPRSKPERKLSSKKPLMQEDKKPRSRAERQIARKFGMELHVSDSFRSRFLNRMSPR